MAIPSEALYGCYLKFAFPRRKITQVVEELKRELLLTKEDVKAGRCGGYTKEEFLRVEETLRYQAGKYLYMLGES